MAGQRLARQIPRGPGLWGWTLALLQAAALALVALVVWQLTGARSGAMRGVLTAVSVAVALALVFLAPWSPRGGRYEIGLANCLSALRLVVSLPLGFYLSQLAVPISGQVVAWIGAVFVTDLLDGWAARALGSDSIAGAALDPVADGACYGAVGAGLAISGAVPPWLAVLVVLRYAVPVAVGAALLATQPARVRLQHTVWGRISTVLIGALLGVALLGRADHSLMRALVIVGGSAIAVSMVLAWRELLGRIQPPSNGDRSAHS